MSIEQTERKALGDLTRPIMIHICRDGTFSYRQIGEPVFNGRALPVFSVDTVEQAEAIQVRFCRTMIGEHPQLPGRTWYKISRLGDGIDPATRPRGLIEYEDLPGITAMFREFYTAHLRSNVS